MRKMKLLLVDDEEGYVRTMAERLAMRDVASQVALSGEEALRAVAEDVPDVMVLDLRMPGIDGMEVLERVRREHPHVQVIVLTGRGSKQDEEEARRLGAFEYLEKPADTRELVKTIGSAWKKALKLLKEGQEGFSRHMEAAAMAEGGAPDLALERLGERASSPGGLRVLFVDDEEDFVRTMAERMQMRDVGGDVALSGAEALAMVEEERPDVMVLDLRMPGMDGMEVLRRVKREHPAVEVIVLTGHGSAQDEAEARRLGAFDYLQKPVDMAVLLETVRKAGRAGRSARPDVGDGAGA
ncbi:MAG TPA: response regulator [Longimicrobiales bacterium]|nr:response regulator [Longimicrobiales bacterium]